MAQVIVVGGGLAGLSAAHTILERGGSVCVIDKNPFFGGNSTKATSGINGALTRTQIAQGIKDSAEQFYQDTAKSARDKLQPALAKVLTYNSASAVEWLQDKFKLDLSLVSRLGGHSQPRTHRGKERFPGMTITYALMELLEDLSLSNDPAIKGRVKIIKKARVFSLVQNEQSTVVGVEYEQNGQNFKEYGPVIIATGGYAADFTSDSLLKKYRPDIYDLPTTNGDHSTGDGIKFALKAGANTIDMDKVQVHPTGLVDPNEPDAKVKFLAAEALRGCGGILLDANGNRFCDELGHRDYVSGEMWKNKGPFRLVLNGAASNEIEWHCKHYVGRGLMIRYKNGQDLAKAMNVSVSKLKETFDKYNEVAKNGKDPYGKKYFHNVPFKVDDFFHVAIVTQVLHFTMGGLQIDDKSQVVGSGGRPVDGLFACGEIGGGVHGANRLGGSSLLGCVVYGRVAGDTASQYLFGKLLKSGGVNSQQSDVGGSNVKIQVGDVEVAVSFKGQSAQQQAGVSSSGGQTTHATAPVHSAGGQSKEVPNNPKKEAAKVDKSRVISAQEVAKHNKKDDIWIIVNGKVLDVTNFLNDHPGGAKALLLYGGKDASEEFNMLHKPDVIEKYAPETVIGVAQGSAKL
ncbi:hypothetical protein MIR68_005006 [Amoeboaphelidium protococcarum]|nr:hypothetical protein MIR68_005006 [Amoeboaphelidium protococcarum]